MLRIQEIDIPPYSAREELLNAATHIFGAAFAVWVLVYGLKLARLHGRELAVESCWIYGLSMLILYLVSSVYHSLPVGNAKRIMRIVDHCTIYALIAGSYTPTLLVAIRPQHPTLAWVIFTAEWGLGLLAGVLTAIDMKKYSRASMSCYIAMGWLIVIALKPTIEAVTLPGFLWLLAGGISYTVGAVLYGIGKKKPYFHTVFHVFVVLGSMLQAVCILQYVL